MKIIILGSTGILGRTLQHYLSDKKIDFITLSRNKNKLPISSSKNSKN